MLYNTVEVFGGDTWNMIPENTWVSSVPSLHVLKCLLLATIARSHFLSPRKHTQCVWRGPMGNWGGFRLTVYLVISLFLVPFCFSQDYLFFLISNDVCMCIREKECSRACRCPWKSEGGVVPQGAGTATPGLGTKNWTWVLCKSSMCS